MKDSIIVITSIAGVELYRGDSKTAINIKAALVEAVRRGANLRGADLYGANLRGADLYGANLGGAHLGGADLGGANLGGADLRGANLYGANLGGANLGGADLGGAHLGGADLCGAHLGGANLGGADLGGAHNLVVGPQRSDGYLFMLIKQTPKVWHVVAGCRNFTMEDAREHWNQTRKNTALGDETFAILDYLETRLKQVQS